MVIGTARGYQCCQNHSNMKRNDRSHKKQEKCLTSGISISNKATLDVSFSVLGLSVSIKFCERTQFHIEKCKRLMLTYKVVEKLQISIKFTNQEGNHELLITAHMPCACI